MEKEVREKIALKRYQIISPVLAEPARAQNDYFRKQAAQEQAFPRYGVRKISVSTLKTWLRKYRRHGFEALKPKDRSDGGRPRRLDDALLLAIQVQCQAYPHYSVQKLYETLQELHLLGDPPVHYNTVLRLIKMNGWLPVQKRTDVRKAFEVDQVNDLWIGDFLHGPQVRAGNRSHKAILCALIDDHSRIVVGHAFSASETINVLTLVLKEAFLAYGIPKRLYLDNGPAFSSDLLAKSCALAGVSLIHSKPYDSPSRGKVERFFRTVRERFLAGVQEGITLAELNQAFWLWLEEDYHLRRHSALGESPLDRYRSAVARVQIRRLSQPELEEIFLVRHERVVNNDATISFKGALYEVPAAYIRQRIELRHPVDEPQELYLYDNGGRVCRVKLLDKGENARTFRPQQVTTQLSFHKKKVRS